MREIVLTPTLSLAEPQNPGMRSMFGVSGIPRISPFIQITYSPTVIVKDKKATVLLELYYKA
jgi:hypothetical protein